MPHYRAEKKYQLSEEAYHRMKSLVSHMLDSDRHSGSDGTYEVRSLYFDTINNMDYFDKEDGLLRRKKIRVRIYSLEDHTVKIELKEKQGSRMFKDCIVTDRIGYEAFMKGDYTHLDFLNADRLFTYLRTDYYRPSVLVKYKREAYVHSCSSIRINFDYDICYSHIETDLFNTQTSFTPASLGKGCLMEVKYNDFIPDWLATGLNQVELTQTSFSKYCLSRRLS